MSTKRSVRRAPAGFEYLRRHVGFQSKYLNRERNVIVALPREYATDESRRFPVLYLHDGQNLFDPTTSFIPGQIWAADVTAHRLARRRSIEPLIVVGIYNTGEHRIDEYTPTVDARMQRGGASALYGRFLVEELRPAVDAAYRTKTDAWSNGLGGSSLGGLASLDIAFRHPGAFGRVAALSPAAWWDRGYIVRVVDALPRPTGQRIWLDMGTSEGRGMLDVARLLRDALLRKGWRLGEDLHYREARGARHTELAWARRVGPMLRFLYPASR